MKIKKIVLLVSFATVSLCANAISSIVIAKEYAVKGEYLKAARLYEQCATDSKGDVESYLMRLHDASECYYMLDDYRNVLRIAKFYTSTLDNAKLDMDSLVFVNLSQRASKVWGTYYYGQTTSDTTDVNYRLAEMNYKAAEKDLDPFDNSGFNEALYMDIAQLYYKWRRYGDALLYLNKLGSTSIIKSQKAMCLARLHQFSKALQLINSALSETKGKESYEMLRKKGKILIMQQDMGDVDNTEAARWCYEQYVQYQINTTSKTLRDMTDSQREQYWLGMHDFLTDCYRLGKHDTKLLYNLALYTKGFLLRYKDGKAENVGWNNVQEALKKKDAAIEFIQYKNKNEENCLGALVLTSYTISEPRFVDIANIDSLLDCKVSNRLPFRTALESKSMDDKNAIYCDSKLPQIIWNENLLHTLDGAKTIYFSSDGILHQLAVEYLFPDSSVTCKRLSSTRVLTERRQKLDTSKMLICGNIDYSSPQEYVNENNDDESYQSLKKYASSLVDLPGTRAEIDTIYTIRHTVNDTLLCGKQTTDKMFRTTSQHYPMIHVATHGYYVGETTCGTDLKQTVSDNVMSESGLAFAGARYALSDSTHHAGQSDGILSAKELSTLSLKNTNLIVLSACQTAQGEISADGVYGVQRALKIAGAKSMIVSLWSVDDKATSLLMQYFYNNLKRTNNIHQAFMSARMQLMELNVKTFDAGSMSSKKKTPYRSPCYADAFVMIDVM